MENEKEFFGILDEWLKKGNIDGKTINQENLDRFNQANIMAFALFKPKTVEFEPPQQNLSFAESSIYTERLEFEKGKTKDAYNEFTAIVDYFNVSPIDSTTIAIRFSVDNVWKE